MWRPLQPPTHAAASLLLLAGPAKTSAPPAKAADWTGLAPLLSLTLYACWGAYISCWLTHLPTCWRTRTCCGATHTPASRPSTSHASMPSWALASQQMLHALAQVPTACACSGPTSRQPPTWTLLFLSGSAPQACWCSTTWTMAARPLPKAAHASSGRPTTSAIATPQLWRPCPP
jgi:hypothetical protein